MRKGLLLTYFCRAIAARRLVMMKVIARNDMCGRHCVGLRRFGLNFLAI